MEKYEIMKINMYMAGGSIRAYPLFSHTYLMLCAKEMVKFTTKTQRTRRCRVRQWRYLFFLAEIVGLRGENMPPAGWCLRVLRVFVVNQYRMGVGENRIGTDQSSNKGEIRTVNTLTTCLKAGTVTRR